MATSSPRPRPGSAARPAVASVTTAAPSAQVERDHRLHVYLLQMGLRVVAFPVAVWLIATRTSVVLGVLLLAFAAVIPYVAVVLANARRVTPAGEGLEAVTVQREALTPTAVVDQDPAGARRPGPGGEVIVGDVVDD